MLKWNIYRNGFLIGMAKSKHDAIKRLEVLLARLLNKEGDFIGKDVIRVGDYSARKEEIR